MSSAEPPHPHPLGCASSTIRLTFETGLELCHANHSCLPSVPGHLHKLGICPWTRRHGLKQGKAFPGLGGCSPEHVFRGYPNPCGCLHCWLTSPRQLSLNSASAGVAAPASPGGVGHPASHSIHGLWEHPMASVGNSVGNFTGFVLPQETPARPHRDRDCEGSGSNLQSGSRLSGSRFNSPEGSLWV